ncbi:FUN14 domain-containing protein 2 isoform X2 [Ambystoma mexicanum]|uniref:FUN14 domain-containing protein 2 isoform X2 n=1 Tax=Ambystoma mexicanum TaxID=8296 RepID=UPI0037E79867
MAAPAQSVASPSSLSVAPPRHVTAEPAAVGVGTRSESGAEWKMASQVGEAVEEAFEALDIAEYAKKQRWWNKVFGQSSGPIAEKYSVATQLAIGGATGWCAGFLFKKVGKLAATAVGGGFFLLQIANHTGYIKVDWKRVEKDVNKAKQQLKIGKSSQKPPREVRTKINEVKMFVNKNIVLSGGFVGGFLIGMAS